MSIPRVQFHSANWQEEAIKGLKEQGVVVISNVFTPDECDEFMRETVGAMYKLCPELKTEWKDDYTPPGPRSGLIQGVAVNLPSIWKIRTDERMREIFTVTYSGIREKPINDFVCSLDGINIRAPVPPYYNEASPDWAHLDQTRGNIFECIQGQAVMSNSTACFRCSPASHLVFDEINAVTPHARGNWNKFRSHEVGIVQKIVEESGGTWQVPVPSERGSVILWLSTTVHSARLQTPDIPPEWTEEFAGWRGVSYVCYRPKDEVDDAFLSRIRQNIEQNLGTNHWGVKTFRHGPRRHTNPPPSIKRFIDNPALVYKEFPELKPQTTPEMLALTTRNGSEPQKPKGSRGPGSPRSARSAGNGRSSRRVQTRS